MDSISQAIEIFKEGKIDEAISVLESIIKEDNVELQIQGKITLADIYLNTGKIEDSISLAEEAVNLSNDIKELDEKTITSLQLHSRLVLIVGKGRLVDSSETMEIIDKTIQEYQNKMDTENSDILSNYANIIGIKGSILTRKGQYDDAIELMRKSLDLHLQAKNTARVSAMNYNLGSIFALKKDFPKALRHLDIAAQIQERSGNILGTGYTNMEIGSIHLKLGDFEKARECFEKEFEIFMQHGAEEQVAWAYTDLGNLNLALGEVEKALDYYNKSLPIYEKLNDPSALANQLSYFGKAYRKLRKYSEALETDNSALKQYSELENNQKIIVQHVSISKNYYLLEDLDNSISSFESALNTMRKNNLEKELEEDVGNYLDYIKENKNGITEKFEEYFLKNY